MYCVIEDGKKISMPRYYKLKIYTDQEKEVIKNSLMVEQLIKSQKDWDRSLRVGIDVILKEGRNKREAAEAAERNFKKQQKSKQEKL